MLGYWNRPDEEKDAFRGSGSFRRSREFDYDGYVWLHGRADEVMNAGAIACLRRRWNAVSSPIRTSPTRPSRTSGRDPAQLSSRLMSSCAMVALSAKPKFLPLRAASGELQAS